ncbi:hypothetical protein N431DRAFT_547195 [Stipitochalara longipes BDJ]|nr:hypothetical protein N431DRAFT_547195 [Stipitochalara longipes BDJ]
MADDSDVYSAIDYKNEKYQIPDDEFSKIRLIQIQRREGNEDPTDSKIVLHMRVAQDPPEKKDRGRFSRLIAKLKPKPEPQKKDCTLVPVIGFPKEDPKVRNRFEWGNYVAMSYTWGKKEEWEITAEEREEAAEKEKKEREKERKDPAYKRLVVEEDDRATYTDGDGEVHEVILDDQRIRVRYNLWAALVAFREMAPFDVDDGTWLWNDALCINQQQTKEGRKDREKQIPLMSRIYQEAGNIIIHVGGADWDTTPWVFDYLQGISVNYRTEYYEALDHAEPTIAHSHRFQARRELEKSARQWVEGAQAEMQAPARQDDTDYAMITLYDFFDRPYWRRLWIIQELAMAHHSAPILCGGFVTQWRYIRDGALLLCMMADTVRDAMQRALKRHGRTMKREPSFEHVAAIAELAMSGNRTIVPQTDTLLLPLQLGPMDVESYSDHPMITATGVGVRMPLMKTLPGSSIQQSLTLAAGSECFLKRDRVLGLLAIPGLSKQLPPKLDVHLASLPTTTDIYLSYAQACIRADHSLDIFSLVDGGSNDPDEGRQFPSWCPLFHVKSKIGRIEGDWHAQPSRPKYNPNDFDSFEFEKKMGPQFEGANMICPGWIIDTVDGLESWPSNGSFLYKRNWDFLQANCDLPIDGKPLSSYFKFQSVNNVSGASISNNPAEHTHHKIAEAHRAMEARTKLRRLMTTSNRPLMGLVPASTQQGDAVIILPYHSRPLIASMITPSNAPKGSGDRVFKLKGEAFIPGVMNGELADSKELDAMPMFSFKFV